MFSFSNFIFGFHGFHLLKKVENDLIRFTEENLVVNN